jgi:predicted small secreted protein
MLKRINYLLVVALLGLTLSGCEKKEGPAEKAGKEVDKAAKDLGQSMEKAADSVKEATKTK